MKTTATNRKVRVLITALKDGSLIPRPEFQRRLVWSQKHKRAFIETVLKQYPFPEIYIAAGEVDPDTAKGTEMLVDGQQRITTLFQYFTGSPELKLNKDIPKYSELKDKDLFLEYEVVVRDLGKLSIEEIKEVFKRINSTSYSLNAMEIKNARYDGAFKKFGEDLAEHDFFERHRIFTDGEVRRMHDIRFTLVLVATMLSTYFRRDDELEGYLETYNDEFDLGDALKQELSEVFAFVDSSDFPSDSRAWKKPDLLNLLVELHRVLFKAKLKPSAKAVGEVLQSFYNKVDNIEQSSSPESDVFAYHQASVQGTNDRKSRIDRGVIIQKLIESATKKRNR